MPHLDDWIFIQCIELRLQIHSLKIERETFKPECVRGRMFEYRISQLTDCQPMPLYIFIYLNNLSNPIIFNLYNPRIRLLIINFAFQSCSFMFFVCYFVEKVGFCLFRQLRNVLLLGYMKHTIRLSLSDRSSGWIIYVWMYAWVTSLILYHYNSFSIELSESVFKRVYKSF